MPTVFIADVLPAAVPHAIFAGGSRSALMCEESLAPPSLVGATDGSRTG